MKRNIFLIIALFVSVYSFGQGEIDAYRISKNDLSGTARGQAMGGAFGALGGDATGIAINPAGIGIYRSSEILLNLGLTFNQTSALLNGTKTSKGNTPFSCDNFGYVGYFPLEKQKGDYSINFGFNYNRLKNFDRKYQVSGSGMGASLTDYIADITTRQNITRSWWGNNSDNQFFASDAPHWLSILGWNTWLINPISDSPNETGYVSRFPNGKVDPRLYVSESGSIGAYDFTLGANLNNKVYVGGTIVYTDISYNAFVLYGEDFVNGVSFNLSNDYSTQGSGVQLKVGVIGRPTDALRLGLSYQSPTWYDLTDSYSGTLEPVNVRDDNNNVVGPVSTPKWDEENNVVNYYKYNFRTPDVWTLSAAYIIGQAAIISLDYEYKDYGKMKFSPRFMNDANFSNENQYIQEDFKGVSTIRAGFEYRFSPQFSGRLGSAWMQQPYSSQFKNGGIEVMTPGTIPNYTIDGSSLYLTGGVGFRFTPQFYMDLALVYRTQQDDLYFFSPTFYDDGSRCVDSTPAKLKNNSFKTLLTMGYKF